MKLAADFSKRLSIKELMELPNRVSHTFYYENFKKLLHDKKHPEEANSNIGEALVEGLSESLS